MWFKRMLVLLTVTALALVLVAGCGGAKEAPKTDAKPAAKTDAPAAKTEAPATADKYPTKPVELVIPFGAGGSHDLHARAIVSAINPYLGGSMVVVLKPGGDGAIGGDYAAKAKPDGYTLMFGGSGPNTQLSFLRDLPYKKSDFIPIAKINHSPSVIVVKSDSKFKSIKDIVDAAKAKPDELRYSSSGTFGATHIPTEMFLEAAKIKAVHVPFNGGGPALTAIMGGHVDFGAPMPTQARPQVQAGALKVLATTDVVRDPTFKDTPTLKELGYDVKYYMWRAVLAPKGTPEPIVAKLRDTFKKLVEDASFKQLIDQLGEKIFYKDGPEFDKEWDQEFKEQETVLKRLAEEEKKKAGAAPAAGAKK